jgi:signal transduction histidine kinase
MSAGSAPPPTESRDRTLERLTGVRSSKPSYYAAWRDKSARLDHTIETLERISSALCAAPGGPGALCDAVVEAARRHFGGPWATMAFAAMPAGDELPAMIIHADGRILHHDGPPAAALSALAERTLAAQRPTVTGPEEFAMPAGDQRPTAAVAAPMPVGDELVGVLAVGLTDDGDVHPSDLSILLTLANHAGVALANARLFQESERRAAELQRRGEELQGTTRRLEQAGRREMLSEDRNRIARELHDRVAQHLLTIGMDLEWCRRQNELSGVLYERLFTAQTLARSAVDEIRAAIFELASDGRTELRSALGEVIADVRAGNRLAVGLRQYGPSRALPDTITHALVQIAREALFNVVRHADAGAAWVTLRWLPASVSLSIADDGGGDVAVLRRRLLAPMAGDQHLGLAGIAERTRRLGGSATFRPRRGGGVRLLVEIPVGGTVDGD